MEVWEISCVIVVIKNIKDPMIVTNFHWMNEWPQFLSNIALFQIKPKNKL